MISQQLAGINTFGNDNLTIKTHKYLRLDLHVFRGLFANLSSRPHVLHFDVRFSTTQPSLYAEFRSAALMM